MLTLSVGRLIILHCLTTSHSVNRGGQFLRCASVLLRKDEDWVCVGRRNIGRKPEWKLNFKKENQKNSRGWTVEDMLQSEKRATRRRSLSDRYEHFRQQWILISWRKKYHLLFQRKKYREFTDTNKWNESYW